MKKSAGRGPFKIFLLLSALFGLFVFSFPLLDEIIPGVTSRVDSFRGYYTGPLFIDSDTNMENSFSNRYHGIKTVMREEQFFHFVPAENINFFFSVDFEDNTDILSKIYLYDTENPNTVLATNLNVPFATGRKAGAFSRKGEEMPDHANCFTYKVKMGVSYVLKVEPEDIGDIGKVFTVRIDVQDGWISLPGLWGLFSGALLLALILWGAIKLLIWNRRQPTVRKH